MEARESTPVNLIFWSQNYVSMRNHHFLLSYNAPATIASQNLESELANRKSENKICNIIITGDINKARTSSDSRVPS